MSGSLCVSISHVNCTLTFNVQLHYSALNLMYNVAYFLTFPQPSAKKKNTLCKV